mmetsp:Transcript_108796/g.314150  ORF Transcript_108796/g.314150 Transcript_108796/m.314150 type:complete len:275 (+) Transcript_108796:594-1418(+)
MRQSVLTNGLFPEYHVLVNVAPLLVRQSSARQDERERDPGQVVDLCPEAHEEKHQRLDVHNRRAQQIRGHEHPLKASQVALNDLRRCLLSFCSASCAWNLVLAVVLPRERRARHGVSRQEAEPLVSWHGQLHLQSQCDEAQVLAGPHHATSRHMRHRLRILRLQLSAALSRWRQDVECLGVRWQWLRQQRLRAQGSDGHDHPPDSVLALQAGVVTQKQAKVRRRIVQGKRELGLWQRALAPSGTPRLRNGRPSLIAIQLEQEVGPRCAKLPGQH